MSVTAAGTSNTVTVKITNTGTGDANDVRLDGFTFPGATGTTPAITGSRDPNRMAVPIVARIPAGGESATATVQLDMTNVPNSTFEASIPFSANGGKARGTLVASVASAVAGTATLVTTSSLARHPDGSYVATVVVTNRRHQGHVQNLQLTGATLGAASGTGLPVGIGNIGPNGQATVTVAFPASAGAPGTNGVEKLTGTYTGGTFGGSYRITLPN